MFPSFFLPFFPAFLIIKTSGLKKFFIIINTYCCYANVMEKLDGRHKKNEEITNNYLHDIDEYVLKIM